jgi:hypothetical protein
LGTSDLDLVKGVVRCDAATFHEWKLHFHEWKEQISSLLAGLSLGHYLTTAIDFATEKDNTICKGNRAHYLVCCGLICCKSLALP